MVNEPAKNTSLRDFMAESKRKGYNPSEPTFVPEISEGSMKINRTKNKIASKISVYDRTVSYANAKQVTLDMQRAEKENLAMKECHFQPQIGQYKPKKYTPSVPSLSLMKTTN